MLRRRGPAAATVLVAALALGACTGPSDPTAPTTPTVTRTVTSHTIVNPTPIVAGPTTSAAGTCRLLDTQQVAHAVGMRLARVTVQRSGGHQVGCRFYALQNSPLAVSERLPGPKQPAVQVTISRYPSATAAHNAMVLAADAGTNPQQVKIQPGNIGLAYQTRFYPKDAGRDWACAFTAGPVLAVIETVTTRTSFNAVTVAKQLVTELG